MAAKQNLDDEFAAFMGEINSLSTPKSAETVSKPAVVHKKPQIIYAAPTGAASTVAPPPAAPAFVYNPPVPQHQHEAAPVSHQAPTTYAIGTPTTEQQQFSKQQSVYNYHREAAHQQRAQPASGHGGQQQTLPGQKKRKRFLRHAAGETWEDKTLEEWPEGFILLRILSYDSCYVVDDYRLFCGDLGNETTDEILSRAFHKYPSFQKAKIVRNKKSRKSKGFGFVSFSDPFDAAKAMREMNG